MITKRSYRMQARADAAAGTRRRVLDATMDLFRSRFRSEIRLDEIAARSGVTVQTLLNIFASRSRLIETAFAELKRTVKAQRLHAQPGDVAGVVTALFAPLRAVRRRRHQEPGRSG